VCAALVVAGCSSGGKSEPTTPASTVVVTTTTVAATTSTSSSTSTSTTSFPMSTSTTSTTTSTTAPPTTSPPTDLSPVTTFKPTADEIGAVKQGVADYWTGYVECLKAPSACDVATFTAANSVERASAEGIVQQMVTDGQHAQADGPEVVVRVEQVGFAGWSSAFVIACVYDPTVILGPPTTGGQPAVVDDDAISTRYGHVVVSDDGAWKVGSVEVENELGEGNQCGG
jgi:hypothetical protein